MPRPPADPPYVELHARSAFSLLQGASSPEALVARAAALGLAGLALADRDDLGGAVRFHRAAADAGLRAIHGAALTLDGGGVLPVLVRDRRGWGNLCRLVTDARMGHPRGEPRTTLDHVAARADGLLALTGGLDGPLALALADGDEPRARALLGQLVEVFGRDGVAVEAWRHGLPWQHRIAARLVALAEAAGLPWVPTGDVRYARPEDRRAHDVLTCLALGCTLDEAGTRLLPSDQWHLRPGRAMALLWRDHPGAVARTVEIADRCRFDLATLRPGLPRLEPDDGRSGDQALRALVEAGARERLGGEPPPAHRRQIDHELRVIERLGLAGYFLIVHDLVAFARRRGVLVQGRGSAANSVVCYCLGITAIDPVAMELLFERFLSEGRSDPPDIDLDFSHMDREEVLQYVFRRYGRRHAAMVCETITWRGRSAVRDVARVLGFEAEVGARLAVQVGHAEAGEAADALEAGGAAACGLDPGAPRVRALVDAVRRLDRLPRHRSIHVGGFVLTAEPLDTVVPIEPASMADRTVIQWDKDDLAPAGLVKIDLLALGILTVLDRCMRYVREGRGVALSLATIPREDPAVFEQIGRADTVGLFQIESRAQMNTLPRLRPRCFYDLVVQVAIIRPGPIQGQMVHPYIRRRRGEEPVTYLHPALEPVLRRTLGIPLFQEQGMKVAITMAGFTPAQADRLRKVVGWKRAMDHLPDIVRELWDGMLARGVERETAMRILGQLEGFANYGFPESHAASFALLTWASAWLRHHFPAEYLAAILNAQPMGFYSPASLVADARRHGVAVRPVDLRASGWDASLEHDVAPPAVRLGLRLVRGLSSAARERLEATLAAGPPASLDDLVERADAAGLPDAVLVTLARAGTLRSLWPGRREALWQVLRRVRERRQSLPLRPAEGAPPPRLPALTAIEQVASDYATLGLSHDAHPLAFHRADLDARGVTASRDLPRAAPERPIRVAGLVTSRQRPASAKGVFFLTLEDEHGMANVVVMPDVFEAHRLLLATAPALVVDGTLELDQGVLNVLGHRFTPLGPAGGTAHARARSFR